VKKLKNYKTQTDMLLHKCISELCRTIPKKCHGKLEDDQNNLLLSIEEKKEVWKNYIVELFQANRPEHDRINDDGDQQLDDGPDILISEIEKAIKDRKSPGLDDMRSEFLKILGECGIKTSTRLYNMVYRQGEIQEEWLNSISVTLPKKANARRCCEFRTVNLISHVLKTFL
jgi:hypothetical protein